MILKNEKIFPLSSAPDLRSLVGGGAIRGSASSFDWREVRVLLLLFARAECAVAERNKH